MSRTLSDIARRMESVVSLGTIAETDHGTGKLRLSLSGRLTGWLPHPAVIGNNFRAWFPARVGTQVSATSPSGDPGNAAIGQTLYTDDLAPPESRGDIDTVVWNDGTTVSYDSGAQQLRIYSKGDIKIRAEGTIWLDAAAIRVFEGG